MLGVEPGSEPVGARIRPGSTALPSQHIPAGDLAEFSLHGLVERPQRLQLRGLTIALNNRGSERCGAANGRSRTPYIEK